MDASLSTLTSGDSGDGEHGKVVGQYTHTHTYTDEHTFHARTNKKTVMCTGTHNHTNTRKTSK